jgi:hypothetical protein
MKYHLHLQSNNIVVSSEIASAYNLIDVRARNIFAV